ncbi:hypothetical protein SME36J_50580 (plasmid) [Serratia marcescens]|nr:hypothetical protein SME36J_50580 [Serratia marcescens]
MRAEDNIFFPLEVVTNNWLQRLLVWTPGQTDLIKTVTLILMVADHTNLLFGLDNDALRLLGRGAFPLFGLVWAMPLSARWRASRYRHAAGCSRTNRIWCGIPMRSGN